MQNVRAALIQTRCELSGASEIAALKSHMVDKAVAQVRDAAGQGANIICLQEVFAGPYFCCEQKSRWFASAERIPDGPTAKLMCALARELGVVLIVPIFEEDSKVRATYYNTAMVIDEDGTLLGIYRKSHIPHCDPGFFEKYYFTPGNTGFPVFTTRFAKIGVYICHDRHFPEGWRLLALNGAEIVFNPSATVAGLSEHLWRLHQPAAACSNMYYVGALNRPGTEAPWSFGEFYGSSYFADPRGQFVGELGKRAEDDVIVRDLDLDLIRQVREGWKLFANRRPDLYHGLASM